MRYFICFLTIMLKFSFLQAGNNPEPKNSISVGMGSPRIFRYLHTVIFSDERIGNYGYKDLRLPILINYQIMLNNKNCLGVFLFNHKAENYISNKTDFGYASTTTIYNRYGLGIDYTIQRGKKVIRYFRLGTGIIYTSKQDAVKAFHNTPPNSSDLVYPSFMPIALSVSLGLKIPFSKSLGLHLETGFQKSILQARFEYKF